VSLERVLGLTALGSISLDSSSGRVAYPAGAAIVLLDPASNRQSFVRGSHKKSLTCLKFSHDGRHVATGESGKDPLVRVWSVEDGGSLVAKLAGHRYAISCLDFSPSSRLLVSVGVEQDMTVSLWDWRAESRLATNKVSSKIFAVAFAFSAHYFVTVGVRHVRFWYFDAPKPPSRGTVPIQSRNAILGEMRNATFVGVHPLPDGGGLLALSNSGQLCHFSERRHVERFVELRTSRAFCLHGAAGRVFVGCARGCVRAFDEQTLRFLFSLPMPHTLGSELGDSTDQPGGRTESPTPSLTAEETVDYPDAVAVAVDTARKRLVVVYADHSLYAWDIAEPTRAKRILAQHYHNGYVWGVDALKSAACLPGNTFATCGADNTVRLWNPQGALVRVIYLLDRRDLLVEDRFADLRRGGGVSSSTGGGSTSRSGGSASPTNTVGGGASTDDSATAASGVRAVRFSADGRWLAIGDRSGNLRLFALESGAPEEAACVEAHDGEVLQLDYYQSRSPAEPDLLVSASRDRLVHLFGIDSVGGGGLQLLATLDDHSGAVYGARVVELADGSRRLITCGTDKSLLLRRLDMSEPWSPKLSLEHNVQSRCSQYAMDCHRQLLAVACQDRSVRVYSALSGKLRRSLRGAMGDDGSLIHCALDPSGCFLATASSDKDVCVIDFHTGQPVAVCQGHSESPLSLVFLPNLRYLVSTGADGCVFVWRLPVSMTMRMRHRLYESNSYASNSYGESEDCGTTDGAEDSEEAESASELVSCAGSLDTGLVRIMGQAEAEGFSLNLGLPAWAQKKLAADQPAAAGEAFAPFPLSSSPPPPLLQPQAPAQQPDSEDQQENFPIFAVINSSREASAAPQSRIVRRAKSASGLDEDDGGVVEASDPSTPVDDEPLNGVEASMPPVAPAASLLLGLDASVLPGDNPSRCSLSAKFAANRKQQPPAGPQAPSSSATQPLVRSQSLRCRSATSAADSSSMASPSGGGGGKPRESLAKMAEDTRRRLQALSGTEPSSRVRPGRGNLSREASRSSASLGIRSQQGSSRRPQSVGKSSSASTTTIAAAPATSTTNASTRPSVTFEVPSKSPSPTPLPLQQEEQLQLQQEKLLEEIQQGDNSHLSTAQEQPESDVNEPPPPMMRARWDRTSKLTRRLARLSCPVTSDDVQEARRLLAASSPSTSPTPSMQTSTAAPVAAPTAESAFEPAQLSSIIDSDAALTTATVARHALASIDDDCQSMSPTRGSTVSPTDSLAESTHTLASVSSGVPAHVVVAPVPVLPVQLEPATPAAQQLLPPTQIATPAPSAASSSSASTVVAASAANSASTSSARAREHVIDEHEDIDESASTVAGVNPPAQSTASLSPFSSATNSTASTSTSTSASASASALSRRPRKLDVNSMLSGMLNNRRRSGAGSAAVRQPAAAPAAVSHQQQSSLPPPVHPKPSPSGGTQSRHSPVAPRQQQQQQQPRRQSSTADLSAQTDCPSTCPQLALDNLDQALDLALISLDGANSPSDSVDAELLARLDARFGRLRARLGMPSQCCADNQLVERLLSEFCERALGQLNASVTGTAATVNASRGGDRLLESTSSSTNSGGGGGSTGGPAARRLPDKA
uniref:WD_REPEATS_REGION domain-containing protein n=2 Tax=Macrostomum lignano TaxID=282301 RepID=A0A1I8IM86_9PLAT